MFATVITLILIPALLLIQRDAAMLVNSIKRSLYPRYECQPC